MHGFYKHKEKAKGVEIKKTVVRKMLAAKNVNKTALADKRTEDIDVDRSSDCSWIFAVLGYRPYKFLFATL